jgi:hypothetical protein
MPNFVSLGAGLRDVGNIASGVGDFMQRERQMDQGDRRLDQGDRDLNMRKEAQDHLFRQQKNQEYGRQLMGVINEANQSARPDGTKFKDLGEFLESDQGSSARDRLTNALADSNSQYRDKLKGAPVRSVRNADGRFIVEAKQGDTWAPVAGDDGQPVSFSGTELAQKSRLDAASAGVAELIYFKRQAKQALDSGHMTQEEYETQVSQLDDQAGQVLDGAEKAGIPREQVVETSRQGDPVNWKDSKPPASAETPSRLGNAIKQGVAAAGAFPGQSGYGVGLATFAKELIKGPPGSEQSTVTAPLINPPANPTNMGVGQFNAPAPATQQPGEAKATPPSAPAWAAPLGPDATKVVTPNEKNTHPVQQEARANRAIDSLERVSLPTASSADGRDAALQYANASTIMGQQPNPQILANLYAGDDMRGSAAAAASRELQYYKAAVKQKATGTQDFANTLKLREQNYKEQNRAAEMAAEAAIPPAPPGLKGGDAARTAQAKQLKNAILLGMSTHNNDLKVIGIDTGQLIASVSTLPVVADMLAKYYIEDMNAARHNASGSKVFSPSTWLKTAKERTTVMSKVLKRLSIIDPEQFKNRIAIGIIAGREPGMAPDDPILKQRLDKTIEYFKQMEIPTNGYDAASQ